MDAGIAKKAAFSAIISWTKPAGTTSKGGVPNATPTWDFQFQYNPSMDQ